jgi:hypothetical protein
MQELREKQILLCGAAGQAAQVVNWPQKGLQALAGLARFWRQAISSAPQPSCHSNTNTEK